MRCFYNSTAWLIGVVGILYLLSDYANASASEEKAKQAAALNYRAYAIKAEKQREWWDTVCPPTYEEDEDGERHPMHFAVPGGHDYDA